MFWIILVFLFLSQTKYSQAQLPLFYQLLEAYKSSTLILVPYSTSQPPSSPLPSIIPVPMPTPTQEIPLNIGGDSPTITIAVLGDSMIDTLHPEIPQLLTALQKYYPGHKFRIINYGVGASNIEYGLFRLTHDYKYLDINYPSLLSQNPDIIIVESFAYNNFGNSQAGIDRHWQNLSNLTSTIKEKAPDAKILLAATIAPNSVIFGNGIPNTNFSSMDKIEKTNTIKLYLQNMVNFATTQNYPLADAYHPSLDNNNQGLTKFINPTDNLHPSVSGGEFFCSLLAKAIYDNKLVQNF